MTTQPPTGQPSAAPNRPIEHLPPASPLASVWIVNRTDEYDGVYVFTDEDRAREYAARHDGAVVGEEVVMNDSAAAQFLIDTADDSGDEDSDDGNGEEVYDHSRAKEDARNAQVGISDADALDAIATMLRDPDWAPGMLEDIAELVSHTGRDCITPEDGEPTWNRH